jgi:predicted HicB family RNase H-like nuclease
VYEGKLRIPIRLKNRIEMLAKERKISFNKMVNIILELGIYELLEEDAEYGKIKHKLVNSK